MKGPQVHEIHRPVEQVGSKGHEVHRPGPTVNLVNYVNVIPSTSRARVRNLGVRDRERGGGKVHHVHKVHGGGPRAISAIPTSPPFAASGKFRKIPIDPHSTTTEGRPRHVWASGSPGVRLGVRVIKYPSPAPVARQAAP